MVVVVGVALRVEAMRMVVVCRVVVPALVFKVLFARNVSLVMVGEVMVVPGPPVGSEALDGSSFFPVTSVVVLEVMVVWVVDCSPAAEASVGDFVMLGVPVLFGGCMLVPETLVATGGLVGGASVALKVTTGPTTAGVVVLVGLTVTTLGVVPEVVLGDSDVVFRVVGWWVVAGGAEEAVGLFPTVAVAVIRCVVVVGVFTIVVLLVTAAVVCGLFVVTLGVVG